MTIAGRLITIVIARFMRHLHQLFLVLDAIGLVAFTVIGCNITLNLGYDTVLVVMSGITTGIFGGILRDLLCNRTPQVLRNELYASVSLVVALLYLFFAASGRGEKYYAACRVQCRFTASHGGHSLESVAAGFQLFEDSLGMIISSSRGPGKFEMRFPSKRER